MIHSEVNIPQGTYKLSDDAIRCVKDLVDTRMRKFINDIEFDSKIIKKYHERLDQYMMKQYPDLSNRLNSLALNLDSTCKNVEKKLKDISCREKKVVTSETLYEDVYKMRDEFKELKKTIEDFQKKMKKVFEI
jgi:hypothetical protein